MGSKPQVLAEFKQGKLLGTVEHFVDTMNWLVPFVANLKGEEGIAIKNPSTDHPLLELNIVAGEGIKITKSNGQMKISAIKEGKKEDDKPTTKKSGGSGSGSGGGGSDGKDPVSFFQSIIYRPGSIFSDNVILAVHMVFLNGFRLDRSEGAKSDMQCQSCYPDTLLFYPV